MGSKKIALKLINRRARKCNRYFYLMSRFKPHFTSLLW